MRVVMPRPAPFVWPAAAAGASPPLKSWRLPRRRRGGVDATGRLVAVVAGHVSLVLLLDIVVVVQADLERILCLARQRHRLDLVAAGRVGGDGSRGRSSSRCRVHASTALAANVHRVAQVAAGGALADVVLRAVRHDLGRRLVGAVAAAVVVVHGRIARAAVSVVLLLELLLSLLWLLLLQVLVVVVLVRFRSAAPRHCSRDCEGSRR